MRRTLIATTGVLALGAGLIFPATASLAADADTSIAAVDAGKRTGVKLTLKGPKTDPVAGDAVTVKGKATVKKQPVAKTKVKLLRKKGSKWVAVGKTKTNKKGKYRKQVTLPNKPTVQLRAKLVKPTRVKGTSKTLTITFAQPAQPVVTVPDAPTGVNAVASDSLVALSWNAPNDGGSPITNYRIQTNNGSGWGTTLSTGNGTETSITVAATNGTGNAYRVIAVNEQGAGTPSPATATVLPKVDGVCLVHNPDYTVLTYGDRAIQKALNDPKFENDTLNVSGTCIEHDITIPNGKVVTLHGTGTIDAQRDSANQGRVIYNKGDLTITGDLTIKGGHVTGNTASYYGGGIYNTNSGTVTVNGGTITGNTAEFGGGIWNLYGTVNLNGGTITGNTATNGGGGIYNSYGTVTLNGGTITNNTADKRGGGIYNTGGGTVTLNGGTITGNTATGEYSTGGGIYHHNSGTVTINGNASISNNTADYGGGIYNTGTVTLDGGTITNNNATNDGGGILNTGTVTLNSGTITGNTASDGGGIYNTNSGTVTLNGGTIGGETETDANTATRDGGGIYNNQDATVTLNGGTITSNEATNGGGIYNNQDATVNRITDDTETSDVVETTPIDRSNPDDDSYWKPFITGNTPDQWYQAP
jgi:predicted outer membrane repeat protein